MSKGFSGEYDLEPLDWQGKWFGKRVYRFVNDDHDPLTYDDGDILVRPDHRFTTDLASIPKTLQWLCPGAFAKDRFPNSVCLHDSGYLHGGHWCASNGSDWHFIPMSRKQIDRYLRDMVKAEGGNRVTAGLIYFGVRIGGMWAFKRKQPTPAQVVI